MAQIGEPLKFIVAEPVFEPVPGVDEPAIVPEHEPEPEPVEVPDGVR